MKFLKKLFLKDVYDEVDELKYKIILMNDKRQLINKKITIDLTDGNPYVNGPIYNLYHHLSGDNDNSSYNIKNRLDELSHVEEGPIIYKKEFSFYDGNSKFYKEGEYYKHILTNATYLLVYYKAVQIIKMSRDKFFIEGKDKINETNSYFLKRLIEIEKDIIFVLAKYSDMFAMYFDFNISKEEEHFIDLIVKAAQFKESQILSNAIVDADLLKEKNKLIGKKLNGDFIYELVSVSRSNFELHFSATCIDQDGKDSPEDVFIEHKFIPMDASNDCESLYLEMFSSIVINTKFFTIEDNT